MARRRKKIASEEKGEITPKIVESKKEREDYAAQMWKKIEKKTALKEVRDDLKGEVKEQKEAKIDEHKGEYKKEEIPENFGIEQKKKRRRRRPRHKKNKIEQGHGGNAPVGEHKNVNKEKQQKEPEKVVTKEVVKGALKGKVKEEPKVQPKEEAPKEIVKEAEPVVQPGQPINPFAAASPGQSFDQPGVVQPAVQPSYQPGFQQPEPQAEPDPYLNDQWGNYQQPVNPFAAQTPQILKTPPPPEYEPRYQDQKNEENVQKEKKDEKLKHEEIMPKVETKAKGEDVAPINPFLSDEKPLDESAFDDRPLKKIEPTPPSEPGEIEEKSIEEEDQAKEVYTTNVEKIDSDLPPTEDSEDKSVQSNEKTSSGEAPLEVAPTNVIDVTPESDNQPLKDKQNFEEEIDEFKSEFWQILGQAGVTKGRVIGFFVCLVVGIFGFLFYFFGWYKVFVFWGDSVDEPTKVEDEIPVDEAYQIISSYIFGTEYAPITPSGISSISKWGDISGVQAGLIFGQDSQFSAQAFVDYVNLIRSLENIYNTDVYNLVNLAVDRREALTKHLNEMDGLINKSMNSYTVLEDELVRLDQEYDRIAAQGSLFEIAFFDDLNQFHGQSAHQDMQTFIKYSQDAVAIKAEYNSKKAVRDMFVNALNIVRPRYEDIKANYEALIKGIRVFDVPGSDIEAIVPVEQE